MAPSPPYTSTELYTALLTHAGTLKDKASADSLAKGLRRMARVQSMRSEGVAEGLTLVEAATVVVETRVPVFCEYLG